MQTMKLFCDVARLRSVSEAAQLHGITQSAASQRISQLERRLNAKLLDRSVRPLELTPAGELYLRETSELVRRYEQLEQRIAGAGSNRQRVHVAAIYSVGIGLLNLIKERFEAEHPEIEVVIEYKAPQQVHDAVVNDECDLGIVSYPDRWRDVEHQALRDEPMAVVCSPKHRLAGTRHVTASELDGLDMAAFEQELPVARRIGDYLRRQKVQPHVTHTFDNIDTIRGAVEVTDVFAILPTRTVQREVEAGRLVAIELTPSLHRPIGLIKRRHKRSGGKGGGRNGANIASVTDESGAAESESNAIEQFIDFLIEHAARSESELDAMKAGSRQMAGGNA